MILSFLNVDNSFKDTHEPNYRKQLSMISFFLFELERKNKNSFNSIYRMTNR